MPPQIVQAIRAWQQCAASSYKAERHMQSGKNAAAEASFAACQTRFDLIVARAGGHGLKAEAVRDALTRSKAALKRQMTAH